MKKEEGEVLLRKIITDELKHQDYRRVVDLAEKYYKLKTGDGDRNPFTKDRNKGNG